jgi:hypothetical protein
MDDGGTVVRFPAVVKMFLISKMYISSLRQIQPPARWTPEALFQGVKRPVNVAGVVYAARFRGG